MNKLKINQISSIARTTVAYVLKRISKPKTDLDWNQYEKLDCQVKRPKRSCELRGFNG